MYNGKYKICTLRPKQKSYSAISFIPTLTSTRIFLGMYKSILAAVEYYTHCVFFI